MPRYPMWPPLDELQSYAYSPFAKRKGKPGQSPVVEVPVSLLEKAMDALVKAAQDYQDVLKALSERLTPEDEQVIENLRLKGFK